MSTFRFRLGLIAPATLALAFSASLAHAQAADDKLPAEAPAEPLAQPAPLSLEPAPPPALPAAAPVALPAAKPAPVDAAADAAAADAAAADAAAAAQAGDASDQFKLNLYGFADFTYTTQLGHFDLAAPNSSFAVGKLNLYAGADLGDNWRSLTEVRFMYVPNGSTAAGATDRTDTTVGDYTDLNRPVKWGGISIERAWLEHAFHPAFTLRAGAFLTPYGIWNVDHGSPVIIGARRPFIIGESLFPEHQTGLEAYGTVNFGPSQFGYHVTLSNGRGPLDTYKNLDGNKALGGRLFFKHDSSVGTFTVGASGYRGKYTDSKEVWAPDSTGKYVPTHPVTARYNELSLAADAKWEWDGLLVQGEAVLNDVAFADSFRPVVYPVAGGPPGVAPDYRRLGVYGLGGYRLPFLGIMPFFGGEYYDVGLYTFSAPAAAVWGGLNVRPTARVVLKAQYTYSWFSAWEGPDYGHYNGIDLQAAWSF